MANPEHLKILKQGVQSWNEWVICNPLERPDFAACDLTRVDLAAIYLAGADLEDGNLAGAQLWSANLGSTLLQRARLTDAYLPNSTLRCSDLSGADLWRANLMEADLQEARLCQADLSESNLTRAKLGKADLRGARLVEANLSGADLSGANLRGANLEGALILDVGLDGAKLGGALISRTELSGLELDQATELELVEHLGPSTLGIDTLSLSNGRVAIQFLRGCGLSDWEIEVSKLYAPGLTASEVNKVLKKVARLRDECQLNSCFISYSHADQSFARRLYSDLQERGVRCWFDVDDMKVGEPILDSVSRAIRKHDKLLLCCSSASLTSSWVEDEVAMAFEIERNENRRILIPLDLDGALADWTSGKAPRIRERLAADFRGWESNEEIYDREFHRVVEALEPDTEDLY